MTTFKIGDKVRRKPKFMGSNWSKDDTTLEVIEVAGDYIYFANVQGHWLAENFDLVEEEPIEKVAVGAVGDKVKARKCWHTRNWTHWDELIVKNVTDNGLYEFEGLVGYVPCMFFDLVESLEEDPTIEEVPFSIGDMVNFKDALIVDDVGIGPWKVVAIDDYMESVKLEGVNVWQRAEDLDWYEFPVKTKEDELREFLEGYDNRCTNPTDYCLGLRDGMGYMIRKSLEILNKN